MDLLILFQAGVQTGTVLLFATMGALLSERSGVMNLGIEGMMLLGAMTAYLVSNQVGNPWVGIAAAMVVSGLISLIHGYISITLQADQVVSGLSLNFLAIGISMVMGEGLNSLQNVPILHAIYIPLLSDIPILGKIFFTDHSVLVYFGYLLIPLLSYYIYRTRPGLHLRAVGEYPAAADSQGISVYGTRYFYVFMGGVLAGLAGATITLSLSPGWFAEKTTGGLGWIAVGLVIFAQWDPTRAAIGAYIFGALRRLTLDIQGPMTLFGFDNPFYYQPYYGFFVKMLPYAFTIIVLVLGSRESTRKRAGAPAALGNPYIRGQRGL